MSTEVVIELRSSSKWATLTVIRPPKRRVTLSATRMGSAFGELGSSATASDGSTATLVNAVPVLIAHPT
ncbi:MAG: hypothetical protein ACRD0V_11745 [Acidimicrobiales bacterium]